MRTGKGDYDERDYRARDAAGNFDDRRRDDRRRDERWHDDDRHDDHVRNSLRPEADDNYRRHDQYGPDGYRRSPEDQGANGRGWIGAQHTSRFPDRSRRVRGERYGLTDWSPAERADGFRDEAPDGMGWSRNSGSFGPRGGYRDEQRGRAAYGRDEIGRDDYGAYGEAVQARGENHAGKGPKGWQRSDERIRDDVSEALARHSALDASDIEVAVDGGEVTLTGTVPDRRTKRMAEDVAETVFAVKDVQNQLRVQREGARSTDSSATTTTSGTIDARQRAKETLTRPVTSNNPK